VLQSIRSAREWASRSYRLLDPFRCQRRVFMLPEAHHKPPRLIEGPVRLPVAFQVASKFGTPVRGIGTRWLEVLRAHVPEAPVDEDGDAGSGEDQIWTDLIFRDDDSFVDSVAKAGGVQDRSDPSLGSGVPPPNGCHVPRPTRRG
jgi:hypothetical protein